MLFFVVSADGDIIDANEYAKSITGCRLNETKFQDLVVDFSGTCDVTALISQPDKEHLINI